MADNKDLLNVLWSGADVLRGKMDANEYKTYLFGINIRKLGFDKENIIKDKNIKKVFYRNNETIIINPYEGEIEINVINDQEKIKEIFQKIY